MYKVLFSPGPGGNFGGSELSPHLWGGRDVRAGLPREVSNWQRLLGLGVFLGHAHASRHAHASDARFQNLVGVAYLEDGRALASQQGAGKHHHLIRLVTARGKVTTFAGHQAAAGFGSCEIVRFDR